MIIFARAPGTTGWVEIKPEEELSHRGQFWEIRKFAVESDDALPLARRLDRAEHALRAAGFKYHGPSEKWLAAKKPTDISARLREYADNNGYSHNDYADTMRAAADEIERYYGGMMAWKATVEAAAVVPEGWKLAPIEPTDAMASAALGVSLDDRSINGVAQYRAMLATAPEAPGGAA